MKEIEIKDLDRKYEAYRLTDKSREKCLLSSIREKGILEPFVCAQNAEGNHILLDGFKRLRCCFRLNIGLVPIVTVGSDETDSILRLIHQSNSRTLSILEQAIFVNELKKGFGLTVSQIAVRLECSPAWVSVRLGIFESMSEFIRTEIFAGRLPVRTYMYTVRQFTRVNKVKPEELDRFVKAVSGKGLSLRQIDTLAYGYFRGSTAMKKQIEQGELSWTLKNLRGYENSPSGDNPEMTEEERRFIRDLELLQKYMQRLLSDFSLQREGSVCFKKTTSVLAGGIVSVLDEFESEIRRMYDHGQPA